MGSRWFKTDRIFRLMAYLSSYATTIKNDWISAHEPKVYRYPANFIDEVEQLFGESSNECKLAKEGASLLGLELFLALEPPTLEWLQATRVKGLYGRDELYELAEELLRKQQLYKWWLAITRLQGRRIHFVLRVYGVPN